MRRASRGRGGWLSLWMAIALPAPPRCPTSGIGRAAENEDQDRRLGLLPYLPYLVLENRQKMVGRE